MKLWDNRTRHAVPNGTPAVSAATAMCKTDKEVGAEHMSTTAQ